jgi:hypothetical protein
LDILTALFIVAGLASLPVAVLVVGVLTNRATPDSLLVRRSRPIAVAGLAIWGVLIIASFLMNSSLYQAVGSTLGIVLLLFFSIAQSTLRSSHPKAD